MAQSNRNLGGLVLVLLTVGVIVAMGVANTFHTSANQSEDRIQAPGTLPADPQAGVAGVDPSPPDPPGYDAKKAHSKVGEPKTGPSKFSALDKDIAADESENGPSFPITNGEDWQIVRKFQGNGIKQTPDFNVPDEWKLDYVVGPHDGDSSVLQVYLGTPGEQGSDILVNTLIKQMTSDETMVHEGGKHYLSVNSDTDWTILVLEQLPTATATVEASVYGPGYPLKVASGTMGCGDAADGLGPESYFKTSDAIYGMSPGGVALFKSDARKLVKKGKDNMHRYEQMVKRSIELCH